MMNYPVAHHLRVMLSRCSSVSAGRGRLLQFDHSALSSRVMEEGDVMEENEDDEDGIRFVTFESRFKNNETVLNW